MNRSMKSRQQGSAATRILSLFAGLLGLLFIFLNPAFAQTPPPVSFSGARIFGAGLAPTAVAVGDFNGDGKPDLAVTDFNGGVSVLLGNGDGTFQPAVSYAAGADPYSIAVGDFNGDGHLDLAVVNWNEGNGGSVSILLGDGEGNFQPAVNHDAGRSPVAIAVGDFNSDGHLDLVVVDQGHGGNNPGGLILMLGNGDGTFQSVNYAAGSHPYSVAVGDFNGDGKPDLAVTYSSELSVLLGNGDGTFQLTATYSSVGGSVAVGDFNGDGKPDLAVISSAGGVSVLLGNGDGTFQPVVNYAAGSTFYTVTVGDFNSDGHPDLALTNSLGGVSVLVGNGDGTFRGAASYAAGLGVTSVVVADFNGDGNPDLAVADGGGVSVLLGYGDGTFPAAGVENYSAGSYPISVAVGDFNGDGKPDLAVADWGANGGPGAAVSVLLSNGDGTFQPAVNYAAGTSPRSIAVGDFNGDGHADLAVANQSSGNVSVLLGNGDGTFRAAVNYPAGSNPSSVAVGDFNGDGKPDLVVANGSDGTLSILLGNGNGTFQPAVNYAAGASGTSTVSVVVGDFNGDGRTDLATVAAYSSGSVSGVAIVLGNGDGTFQAPNVYETGIPLYGGQASLVAGDFNGDGVLDLAVANDYSVVNGAFQDGGAVSVLLGNGDGTFKTAVNYPAGTRPQSIAIADFNGDGKLDLAVADYDEGVSVLVGEGDGTFQSPVTYAAGNAPYSVAVGDFNGDGKPDLAVANYNSGNISILLNTTPTARFNQAPLILLATSPAIFGSTQTLTASGGSGTGEVTFTVGLSTSCSITGNQLRITKGTGTCSVTATKAADLKYDQAISAPVSITVQKATPTIFFNVDGFGYDGKPHGLDGSTTAVGVDGATVVSGTYTYIYTPPGNSTQPILPGIYSVIANFTSSDSNYNNTSATSTLTIVGVTSLFPALNNANQPVAAFGKPSLSAPMTVKPSVPNGTSNTVAFAIVSVDEGSGASGTTFTVTASYGGQPMVSAGPASYDYNYAPISTQVFYLPNPPAGANTLAVKATASAGTIQEIVANLVSFNGVDQTNPVRPGTYQTLHSPDGIAVGSFTATIASNSGDLTLGAVEATFKFATMASNQTVDGAANTYFTVASDHATTSASSVADTWSFASPSAFYAYVGFSIESAAGGSGTPVLTYTATPVSRPYGTDNPNFSGTVTGFTGTDTQANATTGILAFISPTGNLSPVGSYAIDGSGLTANGDKYTFAQSPPNATALTITPATPTIVFNVDGFGYDGNPHPGQAVAIGIDGHTAVSGTFNYTYTSAGLSTPPVNAGTYLVTANFISSDPNYSDATGSEMNTILPRPLNYQAMPVSRSYGAANPVFTGFVTGFAGTDTIANATTGTLTFTSPATIASNVGSYAINGSGLTANSPNYIFSQSPSNATALTITQATPTIVFNVDIFSYTGYPPTGQAVAVAADGRAIVSGTFTYTYTSVGMPTAPVNVGTYLVTANFTSGDPNYTNATGSELNTIFPRTLDYQAAPVSRSYGAANPLFTGTVTGFVGADTLASVTTGPLLFTSPATAASNKGAYPINGSGLTVTNPNYALGQSASNAIALTITDTAPTVTTTGGTFPYDGKPHGATATAVGVDGHTQVSGSFVFQYVYPRTTAPSAIVPSTPGTYDVVTNFNSSDPNYANLLTGCTACLVISPPVLSTTSLNYANQPVACFESSKLSAPMSVSPGGLNTVAFATVSVDEASGAWGPTFNVTATYGGVPMISAGPTSYDYNYAPISTQVFYLVNPPVGTNTLVVNAAASSGSIQEIVANLVSFNGVDQTTPVRPGTYQSLHSADGVAVSSFTATVASSPNDLTLGALEQTFHFADPPSNQTVDATAAEYFAVGSDHATTAAPSISDTWSFTDVSAFYAYVGFSIQAAGGATP